MAIQFKHRGELFIADTPEEAAQMRLLLHKQDADAAQNRARARLLAQHEGPMEQLRAWTEDEAATSWTPERFLAFIERIGQPQQAALAQLVTRHQVTDDELRKAVKVSGNQALAGVLSGISKQAAALDILPRKIFKYENFRTGGKRRNTYTVADEFLQIAHDMSWPHSLPSPPASQK